ncbi:hypothetical protein AGMMS49573_08480 [Endomicrobiia bacterium]|nr:hypothetical protein AGMMS49573_08480 [Endomicrobiia bacterium]
MSTTVFEILFRRFIKVTANRGLVIIILPDFVYFNIRFCPQSAYVTDTSLLIIELQ